MDCEQSILGHSRSQLVSLLDPPVRHRAVSLGQGGVGVSRPDGLGKVDPGAHLPPGVDAQGELGQGGAKDGVGLVCKMYGMVGGEVQEK